MGWIEEGNQKIFEVRKVKRLYDVSPVTYPAYPESESFLRRKELNTMGEVKSRYDMTLEEFEDKHEQDLENLEDSELLRKRATFIDTAQKIRRQAFREKRSLTPKEEKSIEQLLRKINRCADIYNTRNPIDTLLISDDLTALERDLSEPLQKPWRPSSIGYGIGYAEKPKEITLTRDQKLSSIIQQPDNAYDDNRNLSIGKYIRGIVTGRWEGAELERRAMAEGVLGSGGYMVPAPLSLQIIDLARNKAQVMNAGALTVPMDSETLTIAKVSQDPTAGWKAENAAGTASDMAFGAVKFQAKTLFAMCKLSVELAEDAPNIDRVVENALAEALALELDRAALFGSGTNDEPTGIFNTTGIQTYLMGENGAALTNFDPFSLAVQKVLEANGTPRALIWAPRTAGEVDRLKDSTGQPLQPPESFRVLSKFVTKQVPTNLTQGTATNASCGFVADWSQLLVGVRTNLVIEASRVAADGAGSAFQNLQVWIRAYLRADVQLARPEHFCIIKGIIPPA